MAQRFWSVSGVCLLLGAAAAAGADWPQWRGPDRTGISKETGLMKSWPEGGPKQLWQIETPAKGYAAPSVVVGAIYLTGTLDKKAVLYALDLGGKVKWQQVYGTEWTANYPMSRTTPTFHDGSLYIYSGGGSAACLEAATGKIRWQVDTLAKFKGQNIEWGIAESPLVYEDLFICHPGGRDAAIVALDRNTGETVWTSKGLSEKSAYCSPLLVELGGGKRILTQTENHVVGLDAKSGEVLWKVPQRNRYAVHPNTPIFLDGLAFISCGYGYGSMLLKLSADGRGAQQVWTEKKLDSHHEGVLLINGLIYGSPSGGRLLCLNPKDGKVIYEVKEIKKAAITYADGRLYAYDEKGGEVSLVDVRPDGYRMEGSFPVKAGDGPHWAHPVVANGVLYIRRGGAFLAYDVKAK